MAVSPVESAGALLCRLREFGTGVDLGGGTLGLPDRARARPAEVDPVRVDLPLVAVRLGAGRAGHAPEGLDLARVHETSGIGLETGVLFLRPDQGASVVRHGQSSIAS